MINNKKGRYYILVIVFIAGVAMSATSYYLTYGYEEGRIRSEFKDAADYHFKNIEDAVQNAIAALYSFRDFYAASKSVERDEFESFSKGIFVRQPYIFEFRWLQRVKSGEREAFERSARANGLPDFFIKDINDKGEFIVAPEHEEYFTIYFINSSAEHIFDHSQLYGVNAASVPTRWKAMQQAIDSGLLCGTEESEHAGEADIPAVSRVFLPIYKNNFPHATVEERRQNMTGFVVLLYQVDKLIAYYLNNLPAVGMDISIYNTSGDSKKLLHVHSSLTRAEPLKEPPKVSKNSLAVIKKMNVANQEWELVFTPAPYFLNHHKIILPWGLLALGLALTLTAVLYLKNLIGRTKIVENLVEQRTAQLLKAEARYKIIYESSRDAIMTIAPPGWKFTAGNPATIKLFGAKDEKEFLSFAPWQLSPERQPDGEPSASKAMNMINKAVKEGFNFFEWMHKRIDGKEFFATVLLTKMELDGKPFIQATVRDITDHKIVEDKLARANREWLDTFNSITDFVFILDKDSRITKVNNAFLNALNLEEKDVIGRPCYEVVHKKGMPWPDCPHQKTIADNKAHTEVVEDPGLGLPILVTTSPILNAEGKLLGSVHIAKDISGIKKAEEDLRKSKKELEIESWGIAKANEGIKILYKELEEKNKELSKLDQLKSDFVSTVSHELRTPLSITKEGLSLVLDEISGKINPKQSNILTTAKDNIDRLARIINDLLDISKIEAGKVELKRDLVNLAELIGKTAAEFKKSAKDKGLEFIMNFSKSQIDVYVDPDKIIQVFTNLIGNALKFTERGHILISAKEENGTVECVVEDTGAGISKENLPKAFSKFQQFGRAAGPGEKGTGLGLAIVRGIIGMHKGNIRIESELGKGTKIVFTLPAYSTEAMFREYAHMGISDALRAESSMSLFIVAVKGFDEIRKNIPKEKVRAVLSGLEGIIKDNLRRAGDAIAKDTGEIIVILSGCIKENAINVITRLRQALDDYLSKENISNDFKLKIGYATYPQDGESEEELIKKARQSAA